MSGERSPRRRAPLALLAAAWLGACAGGAAGPPAVRWGVDECSHCHMILAEERFAAVGRSAAGEEVRFDDLECAARFLADRAAESWTAWAHDSAGPEWLPAAAAAYAATDTVTPMGSGLLAFASAEAARAAGGGEPLGWSDVRARAALPAAPR